MTSTEPELSLVPRTDMVRVLRKQTYYPDLRRWVDVALGLIGVQIMMTVFITAKGGASFAAYGFLAALYPIVVIAIVRVVVQALVDIADGIVELRLKAGRSATPTPP